MLTFILSFDANQWYWRPLFLPAAVGCFGWLIYVLQNINDVGIGWQVPAFCLTMFVACMVCHGELYALKPHPRWLTSFYLMISLGGAIGGFLVAVVAPHVFKSYAELSVVGEVLGQGPGEGTHGVPAPVGAELDVEHLDRQRIAALGPLDIDRPRQNMAAQMRRQLAQDFKVLGQDVHGRLRQDLPTARHAMDGGDVARLDSQRGLQLAVEVAPMACVGRGMKFVRGQISLP